MSYAENNSGRCGQLVRVAIRTSFFPRSFTVVAEDENAETAHWIRTKRFIYQSRDSPQDLLARDKWKSQRCDRFTETVYADNPRLSGAPRELRATAICSWDPAFAVAEFRYGDTYYQFSCMPPRGVNSWARLSFPLPRIPEDSVPDHEPASGSAEPPPSITVSQPPDRGEALESDSAIDLSQSPFGWSDS